MRRHRKTKILATLGPASNTPQMMRALFEAGVDVFRINMSHTDHAMLARMAADLRALSQTVGRPVGILVDLQGPKIRLSQLVAEHRAGFAHEQKRIKRHAVGQAAGPYFGPVKAWVPVVRYTHHIGFVDQSGFDTKTVLQLALHRHHSADRKVDVVWNLACLHQGLAFGDRDQFKVG
jgi:hypothetical protein